MKIAITGINGRMGEYVHNILKNREGYEVVCGISKKEVKYKDVKIYTTIIEAIQNEKIDAVIDFTNGESFSEIAKNCLENNIKLISGTTGVKSEDINQMINLSIKNNTTFVHIPNFARGASEVYNLLENISNKYESVDIEETHHKSKVDKPSGTALEYSNLLRIQKNEVKSIRIDNVIASHEITLSNPGEKLVIRHEINHRDAFLSGFIDVLNKVYSNKYVLVVGLKGFYKL